MLKGHAFYKKSTYIISMIVASGFGFTSFCLWRFDLSQSILIHRPRSKVNNKLFFFVKSKNDINIFSIA